MTKDLHDEKNNIEAMDSDCLEAFDHVYAYINNELKDQETIDKIEHHLSHCKSCFTRAQMERIINARLKESSQKKTPEQLQKRLKNLIEGF